MNTDERILNTALRLFNARGTARVSTNHIAAALSISPGNLYYHYLNKEEIVRALFKRLVAEWQAIYALPPDRAPMLKDLEAMLRGNFQTLWRYRFFYREMLALTQRDPRLLARYREVRSQGFANFARLFEAFAKSGVLRKPERPQALRELAQVCWLVGDFWMAFAELGGDKVSPRKLDEGIALLKVVLRPYLQSEERRQRHGAKH